MATTNSLSVSRAKIVIIEDEFFAASHLKELVTELGFSVVGIYHSGEEFLKKTDWNFDAALVDIFLSWELTGLDIAPKITALNKPFVFITANKDHETLKWAARLSPAAYISKPFHAIDITAALEIIAHNLPKRIKVRSHNGENYINPNDITHIKSDGVYIEIHCRDNRTYIERKLLKEIESDLPKTFIRVHRSFIVNTNYVLSYSSNHITMKEMEIPISKSFRDNIENIKS